MAVSDYLFSQYPNCVYTIHGEDPSTLTWSDNNPNEKPTMEELNANLDFPPVSLSEAEAESIRISVARNEYKNLRANEYPPITDYLDGVVKGDQAQIDAYVAACQAVKAKYPKPA